jgi:hypothetical protein
MAASQHLLATRSLPESYLSFTSIEDHYCCFILSPNTHTFLRLLRRSQATKKKATCSVNKSVEDVYEDLYGIRAEECK